MIGAAIGGSVCRAFGGPAGTIVTGLGVGRTVDNLTGASVGKPVDGVKVFPIATGFVVNSGKKNGIDVIGLRTSAGINEELLSAVDNFVMGDLGFSAKFGGCCIGEFAFVGADGIAETRTEEVGTCLFGSISTGRAVPISLGPIVSFIRKLVGSIWACTSLVVIEGELVSFIGLVGDCPFTDISSQAFKTFGWLK